MAKPVSIEVWNPNGKYRVVSTKPMPGTRWINLLIQQDCRLEVINFFFLFALFSVVESTISMHFMCFLFILLYSDMYREENNSVS